MGMNLRVRERGEGSASGWIEKGMMGRHRQIIMNMQQILLYPLELQFQMVLYFGHTLFHNILCFSCVKFLFMHASCFFV